MTISKIKAWTFVTFIKKKIFNVLYLNRTKFKNKNENFQKTNNKVNNFFKAGFPKFFFQIAPFKELKKAFEPSIKTTVKTTI